MNVSRMTLRGAVTGRALGIGTRGLVSGHVLRRSKGAAEMIGVGFACVVALAWFPPPAQATYPGRNGSILFWRNDGYYKVKVGGKPHLFVPMQPTGTPELFGPPAVNRSGRRWAFGSDEHGFYLGRLDQPALQLVDLTTAATFPAWAPDGRRVAVQSGGQNIVTVTTQGGDLTRFGFGFGPSWSSRGRLAYSGLRAVVVRDPADPASKSYLAHTTWDDNFVDWSPDGRRLLVTRGVEKAALWVIRADGSGARRLRAGALFGRWSPDGQSIVFEDKNGVVWVMSARGGRARRITVDGDWPVWLPATK